MKFKTADKKKSEIRLNPALYEKIYDLVYIQKRFKSLNEAYESLLELGIEKFMENV
jgi:hypothetical protein